MSDNSQNKQKNIIKSLKDIKSAEDLDQGKVEFFRGETPPDIEEKCLKLCKEYLGGNWIQQTIDTIAVKRVLGGLKNQIYHCAIREPNSSEEAPQEVAVKLYGKNVYASLESSRTRDVVDALIFSEKNLGPKIYGLFEEGQIQKYYKHRQFSIQDQKDPVLRETLFKTLAKIHSLEVPLKKDPNFMSYLINERYEYAFEKFDIKNEMDEFNCETMKRCDLRVEIDFVLNLTKNSESPVVLTHHDLGYANIMVTEPNDQLVVCDFDRTGYGYRGYDFVSLFRDWGRTHYNSTPVPGIPFKDQEIKPLIEIYVEECQRINGKSYSENEINSVKHILIEVKKLLLFSAMYNVVFFISNDEKNGGVALCRKVCMEMCENTLKYYNGIKNDLKEQNII